MPRILFGAAAPLMIAWALGRALPGRLTGVTAFAAGAVVESLVVFLLLAGRIAHPAAFLALLAASVAIAWKHRPSFAGWKSPPLPFLLVYAAFGALYLIHALAPEIQPDGVAYHLGLAAEYARTGAFSRRVAFFEILPQGLEMLFTVAYAFGGGSSAKLVHLAFLVATVPLLERLGRKLELPEWAAPAAAVLYGCAPVVGLAGSATYTDAAGVFFLLAALLALLEERPALAGLFAGFCYAVKISGALVPAALVVVWLARRQWRNAALSSAAALVGVAPWMLRAWIDTGSPVAPLFNAWFPNPYFHLTVEQSLRASWHSYEGFSWVSAPWDLAIGGRLQGVYGPLLLALPVGLLALRRRAGRVLWCAAVIAALPWLGNFGARFLMPAVALGFLAFAASLPRPMVFAAALLQAIACWPAVLALYVHHEVWRLRETPVAAALRLEPEAVYLRRNLWEFEVADLLRQNIPAGKRVLAMFDVPRAYTSADITEWWQSAEGERAMDTLRTASPLVSDPLYEIRAAWPAQLVTGFRLRAGAGDAGEWDLHSIELSSGGDRIHTSPQWTLEGWPNRWEVPLALDDNPATRWRTWQPLRTGMFVQAVFDRPQRAAELHFTTHVPGRRVELYLRGLDGKWRPASLAEPNRLEARDVRRQAVRYLRRLGFDYLLAPAEYVGAWALGVTIVGKESEWGLVPADRRGFVTLEKIP